MLNANKNNLEDILARSVKYTVPNYQRNFEWKVDQAREFWQDTQTPNTFLGTIVLNVSKKESIKEIEIVDGQQRLTTIFILLSAIRTIAKKIGNQAQATAIQNFISFIDNKSGVSGSSKLVVSESIRDAFNETIVDFNWDGKDFNLKNLKNKKREVNRIKPIYNFFIDKISKFDTNNITELLTNLYSSSFVEIEIQNTEEAFEIFERTNARGLDLNAADLLKNYLFAQSEIVDTEDRWDQVVEYSSGNVLNMIKYFYVSKKGSVRKKDLFSKLKNNYGDIVGADKFLEELVRFAKLYDLILRKGKDDFIEYGKEYGIEYFQSEYNAQEINRNLDAVNLFGISQSYPLILKTLDFLTTMEPSRDKEVFAKQVNQLIKIIENYHFINSAVAQRPGNEVEKFYADICEADLNTTSIKNILEKVKSEFSKQKVGINEFVERFKELNYQNDYKLIFYINDRLNNIGNSGGQVLDIYDSDSKALRRNFDMEHLFAQDNSEYEVNKDHYEEVVHNIGNLIVISKHTNGGIGNKHVSEKLPILIDKERKLREVELLVEEWQDKKWNSIEEIEESIANRSENMAKRAYEKCWVI
jgi:uncharacterized protein with ParB-like and HNH nuclease domain